MEKQITVKRKKTTLTGKEKVMYERMRDFSFGGGRAGRVSQHTHIRKLVFMLKTVTCDKDLGGVMSCF